jgi:hypothetical protein
MSAERRLPAVPFAQIAAIPRAWRRGRIGPPQSLKGSVCLRLDGGKRGFADVAFRGLAVGHSLNNRTVARAKLAGNRHGFLRRKDSQPTGRCPTRQVMSINKMRDGLETEEVGIAAGRIEDVGRERRIGHDLEREPAFRPKNSCAAVPAEKRIVDPRRGKRTRRCEIPLWAGRDRRLADRQMVAILQRDSSSFRQ